MTLLMNSRTTRTGRPYPNRRDAITAESATKPSLRSSRLRGLRSICFPKCNCAAMRALGAVVLALLVGSSSVSHAAESASNLGDALLLHASFDKGLNADVAAGDPVLYNSTTGNRKEARPGLPEDNLVTLAKGEGRFGDALRFHKKTRPVFFRGEKNLGYRTNQWSGAVSLWLRLDPDKDLELGYCDPLQFVGQGWEEGTCSSSSARTTRRGIFVTPSCR